jgi:hypothetical protein
VPITTKVVSLDPVHWRGVLDITLCDKVCQRLSTGQWFSLGTPVSSVNKTDNHDITKILLRVTLNTINLNLSLCIIPDLSSNGFLIKEPICQTPTCMSADGLGIHYNLFSS